MRSASMEPDNIVTGHSDRSVPKLFVNSEPGGLTGSLRDFCRTWSAQREVTVRGLHFLQEDSPHEIGRAIADWLASIDG